MAKTYPNGRSKPTFVMLRHDLIDSLAWQNLKPVAQSIWVLISRRYNGFNNGEIPLSCREVAEKLHISKSTSTKGFKELMDKGFVRVGQDSAFNVKTKKSRRWIVTHQPHNGQPPTCDWRKWKKQNTV